MRKAAVFILLGQSNAVGHKLPMPEAEQIRTPMKNVFGLSRAQHQSYELSALRWSGYTSDGMNLAEEQDHTYSVANCLARLWQDAIDDGELLPDLYIVHIAVGAQGVTEGYMWHPDYGKIIVPGKLGTVKIALTHLTAHVLSLLKSSIRALGAEPEIIGIHWRGGENDFYEGAEVHRPVLEALYENILGQFYGALGEKAKTVLHRLACVDRPGCPVALENLHFINGVFDSLAASHENISVFDVRNAPQFVPGVRCNGIFKDDAVHFTEAVNQWVAQQILQDYRRR